MEITGEYWRIQVKICTHKCQEAVDIVSIEDDAMDTAKGDVKYKASESSVIVVTNTTVHPRTMVVHLFTTPGQEGEEKEEEEVGKKRERERNKMRRSRLRRRWGEGGEGGGGVEGGGS